MNKFYKLWAWSTEFTCKEWLLPHIICASFIKDLPSIKTMSSVFGNYIMVAPLLNIVNHLIFVASEFDDFKRLIYWHSLIFAVFQFNDYIFYIPTCAKNYFLLR